mmetsp:Transcript_144775/g.361037  ORF Transcript_144775/g.361037 Transcript_144775/m.361037 type:complete len:296 (+) Transcript_144775:1706-2593(+)
MFLGNVLIRDFGTLACPRLGALCRPSSACLATEACNSCSLLRFTGVVVCPSTIGKSFAAAAPSAPAPEGVLTARRGEALGALKEACAEEGRSFTSSCGSPRRALLPRWPAPLFSAAAGAAGCSSPPEDSPSPESVWWPRSKGSLQSSEESEVSRGCMAWCSTQRPSTLAALDACLSLGRSHAAWSKYFWIWLHRASGKLPPRASRTPETNEGPRMNLRTRSHVSFLEANFGLAMRATASATRRIGSSRLSLSLALRLLLSASLIRRVYPSMLGMWMIKCLNSEQACCRVASGKSA